MQAGWCIGPLLALGLPAGAAVPAPAGAPPSDQFVQRRWTTDDGLPQNSVLAIAQAPDGHLWLGTQEGLARFDGLSFAPYDRGNAPALGSNFVMALAADPKGALWIGTGGGGLTRLAGGELHTWNVQSGLPSDVVTALTVDEAGVLWVGTHGGLCRLSGRELTCLRAQEGLADDKVTALHRGAAGSLWVSTESGLQRLEGGRIGPPIRLPPGMAAGRINAILEDGAGRLWLGTAAAGLARIEAGGATVFRKAQGLEGERVLSLLEDRRGDIWVGTSSALLRWAGDRLEAVVAAGPVLSLAVDEDEGLWMGTEAGLVHLRPALLRVFDVRQGLPRDGVLTIHEDRHRALWLGTAGGGLVRMRGGRVDGAWSRRDGLARDEVTAVYTDSKGVWVGFLAGGVQYIQDDRVRPARGAAALDRATVLSLLVDGAGRLWVGTLGRGLFLAEGGRWSQYRKADGLADDTVFSLKEARDGSLWIGTRSGLSRLRAGRFQADEAVRALAGPSIMSIHEDGEGALWVGTYARGLHLFHGGRHSVLSRAQGLPDDVVFHVLEDDDGFLWMSSNKGLFSAAKAELLAVAAGRQPRVAVSSYGKADGLRSAEGNGGSQPGAWRRQDGTLWFPTAGGAVAIEPARARSSGSRRPPALHLREVRVNGEHLAPGRPMRVPVGRGNLEVDYLAISFLSPETVSYEYRLDGFDADWVKAGPRRTAYYTNLPPGEFRLRVKAASGGGPWSEQVVAGPLVLTPAVHQTPWFKAAVGLLLMALGAGLYHVRLVRRRARRAVSTERVRMARELHDGLIQELAGVALQIDVALGLIGSTPEQARRPLEQARSCARQSMAEARRMVSALRPSVQSMAQLADRLRGTLRLVAGETAYTVELEGDRPLPPHVGAALLRVGQEALSNALRHGQPGSLRVNLRADASAVEMSIEDDGRGFDPLAAARSGGLGLIGMQERAESLGGQLAVRSQPGAGARVELVVPMRAKESELAGNL